MRQKNRAPLLKELRLWIFSYLVFKEFKLLSDIDKYHVLAAIGRGMVRVGDYCYKERIIDNLTQTGWLSPSTLLPGQYNEGHKADLIKKSLCSKDLCSIYEAYRSIFENDRKPIMQVSGNW